MTNINTNTKFYDIFNTKLNEFMVDLIKTFPDDVDFKLFRNSLKLLIMADNRKPQQLFSKYLTKTYRENIQKRNDEFFINTKYEDIKDKEVNDNKSDDKDNINRQLLDKLKGYWGILNEANRDIIWKYFEILVKIHDKCVS